MKFAENVGASCNNCKYQGGINKKACRQCENKSGMPGWDPAPGVKTKVFPLYSGPKLKLQQCRQVIEIESEAI